MTTWKRALRFTLCLLHHTVIIRTRFRLGMGSGYCFSLRDSRIRISETAS